MRRILFLCLSLWLVPVLAGATPSTPTILVYGDSLSSGYGVPREQNWVSLLARKLAETGSGYTVVNASVSGETTSGGLRRIEDTLRTQKPSIVVLELGANDGLRGQPIDAMQRNLDSMIQASRRSGAHVVLVGMRLPPNYGKAYTEKFHQTFVDLARRHKLPLVPFLFEGFADNRGYFQADTVHPTAQAQPLMLDTVWRALGPLLGR